jgi:hypothetical protein
MPAGGPENVLKVLSTINPAIKLLQTKHGELTPLTSYKSKGEMSGRTSRSSGVIRHDHRFEKVANREES